MSRSRSNTLNLWRELFSHVLMKICILGTMIAYGVWMLTEILDRQYELCVKGQGQMYSKSAFWLVTHTSLSFFHWGVNIWHDGCLWCVEHNKGLGGWYDWGQRSVSNLHNLCLLVCYMNSSYMFWWRVFIFDKLVTCGTYMKMKVLDRQYGSNKK